jgi:flagellar hook-length control protein FliK
VRKAAGDEATARITEFLEANTGKELPKQAAATLSMLKGILSQQEFAGIDQALRSFNPDPTATIQPFTFDKGLFDALAKSLGEQPSGMKGSYTQEVLDQIRRAVPTAVKGNEGSMSLKLNPPMLGRLDIDIRMEDGRITATFKAEQPLTRDILQQNMHVLKEAFSDQGIKATQFVVTTDAFTARDHREAFAWFGSGTGRGGSRGQGGGQDTGDASRRDEALGHGYTPVRRYGEGGGLDIFA